MHGYRRFCNKIYQATKFVLSNLPSSFTPNATPTLTGQESLAEKWILHKMTIAAKEANQAFTDREFSIATGTMYQYWYTSLCDTYIENSKSLLEGPAEQKLSAQNTLYTALEAGLTMIHPFMPFLTEELWQRLPRRPGDKCPSIVIAKYPNYNPALHDPAAEEAYDLLLAISKGIRSLMATYAIKDSGHIAIQLATPTALETCTAELASIRSLSGKGVSEIAILSSRDPKPAGTVAYAVSSEAAVFLQVKGRVDIQAEIGKIQKRLERANEGVKKVRGVLEAEGYREKVKGEVQELERKKLEDGVAEVRVLQESL